MSCASRALGRTGMQEGGGAGLGMEMELVERDWPRGSEGTLPKEALGLALTKEAQTGCWLSLGSTERKFSHPLHTGTQELGPC